jgi:hypothetical protein
MGVPESVGTNATAAAGWRSRLTIGVVALLVIESITGLWIYLAPFSLVAQAQVLLHTVAGIALVAPFAVYQVQHFRTWFRQSLTAVMFVGYALGAMVIVCVVSGVVVTWQSAFGTRVSGFWDLVHLVSGIGTLALIIAHVLLAFLRRRVAARKFPDFGLALRRFALHTTAWVAATAVLLALAAPLLPFSSPERPLPADYTLSSYIEQFDEYRGSPFAPSYARTEHGGLVDPSVLAGSPGCGTSGCHTEILEEWQPSAHRFSAMNPPFMQVQKDFAVDRSAVETRYCAGCHDPISLFAGAKDIHDLDLTAPGMQEGSSCVVCHSISMVDQRGNGDYVLTPPRKYLWEGTDGVPKFVSDFLIRAYPRQHLADYDRNLLRTPEFCGACHKQFIPEALNRFGLSPGQNQYDEWRQSHWHVDDPESDLSCRDCHMRLVQDSRDPGRGEAGDTRRRPDDGAHRHHGMIATNLLMPEVLKLPHWERHVELTKEWMRGDTVIPEIADRWPEGPVASVRVLAPETVAPGETASVRIIVENRKAGHNLTTGPLDFVRTWLHVRVADEHGATIAEWGAIDPDTRAITDAPGVVHEAGNRRDEGTLVLEGVPVDAEGNPLIRHELWKKAGGEGARTIFPRYSDNQVYRFEVPSSATGPLVVSADLNFRRYRQEFLDLVVPTMESDSGVIQPTVTKTSAEARIEIAEAVSMRRPASPSAP